MTYVPVLGDDTLRRPVFLCVLRIRFFLLHSPREAMPLRGFVAYWGVNGLLPKIEEKVMADNRALGRPTYGGKYAKAYRFVKITNHSDPTDNASILARNKATEREFYKDVFEVLAEIKQNVPNKS